MLEKLKYVIGKVVGKTCLDFADDIYMKKHNVVRQADNDGGIDIVINDKLVYNISISGVSTNYTTFELPEEEEIEPKAKQKEPNTSEDNVKAIEDVPEETITIPTTEEVPIPEDDMLNKFYNPGKNNKKKIIKKKK